MKHYFVIIINILLAFMIMVICRWSLMCVYVQVGLKTVVSLIGIHASFAY